MRKYFKWVLLLTIVSIFFACGGEKREATVIGKWEFGGFVGQKNSRGTSTSTFNFYENGIFERSALGRTLKGSWILNSNDGQQIINLTPAEGAPFQMVILELTPDKLTFHDNGPMKRKQFLVRPPDQPEEKKRVGKKRAI